MLPTVHRRADPAGVNEILRSLPEWFGIADAITGYVKQAAELDSYVAVDQSGMSVGVALINRHFPESAELALIAVHADQRSSGIGRLLVEAAERVLATEGCQFLEVHTVGASFEHAGYAATRAFYRAVGFSPMHEFERLDWDGPTVIMVKHLAAATP